VKEKVPALMVSDLTELSPVCVEHEGVPYCVIKLQEKINAFVSVCSHEDLAMFPPKMKNGLLVCPHHKVGFDPLTGVVIKDRGKDADDLLGVEVEVVDGVIYLEVRKKHRKIAPKSVRKWVLKESKKLEKKRMGEKA
jgi:nitrite reductase/ring-hydroxylating ferredoxin subunit